MRRTGLTIAILLLSSTCASAAEGDYFRLLQSPGGIPLPTFVSQPAPTAYLAGSSVSSPPMSLSNALAPVTHALVTPGGDITGTLPQLCPGLAFSTSEGNVTGDPTGSCDIPVVRIASTDANGRQVTSEPFSLSVVKPSLSLDAGSGAVREGMVLTIKPSTNIPSPSWNVAGAPPGSTPSFASDGTLSLYAPDVSASGVYPLTITASKDGVSKSATFSLSIAPVAANTTSSPSSAVHAGGAFAFQVSTDAPYAGQWQATGAVPVSFASPASKATQATGTAPANAGGAAQARRIDYAFVDSNAPSDAVPAMATGTTTVSVHPSLSIQGVTGPYVVSEGQSFGLSPSASTGSLIGQATWSQSGLPGNLTLDPANGRISGTLSGGTAAGGARSVTLTLKDSGDASALGTATASFQITPTAAAYMTTTPTSLVLPAQALPAETGQCAAFSVTNGGSLGATSVALSIDSGQSSFKACTPATGTPVACTGSLAAGASCRFGLQMASTASGTFFGTASVKGSNFNPVTVQMSGSATAATPSAADTCYTTVYRNGYPQLAFSRPIYANGYYYSASWPSDPLLNGTYARVFGIERTSTGGEGYRFPETNWYVPRNTPGSRQAHIPDPYTSQIQYFNMAATLPAGGTITGYPTYNGVSKGPC